MRKSRGVAISFVSHLAGAALASGCGSSRAQQQGWQTCVDRGRSTAVEQRDCDDEGSRAGDVWLRAPLRVVLLSSELLLGGAPNRSGRAWRRQLQRAAVRVHADGAE